MNLNGQQSNPESDTLTQLASLSRGEQPNLEPETPQQAEPELEETEPQVASEDAIIIDGKTFNSAREAYDYSQKKLQESETERLIIQAKQEAFEQALQMGQTRQQAQQAAEETTVPIDDSDEFYANPQEYLRNKLQSMREQVRNELKQELSQEELDRKAWNDFFTKHPDLDGFKSDCEQVLNANLDTIKLLAVKDRDKAMDFLANKTREKFQSYMERLKPRSVLPNTYAAPSVGGNPTQSVTPATKEDGPLDFVSQLRSNKNRYL